MGANLVAAAYIYAPGRISPRAFVVLGLMALTALDNAARPMYFGGSEPLERALGLEPGTEAAKRAVKRALAELVGARLVEQVPGFARSHNRRWLITINPHAVADDLSTPGVQESLLSLVDNPVDEGPGGDTHVPSCGDTSVPCEGTPVSPMRGHPCPVEGTPVSPPEEPRGTKEESGEEEITVSESLTRLRADLASKRLATGEGA